VYTPCNIIGGKPLIPSPTEKPRVAVCRSGILRMGTLEATLLHFRLYALDHRGVHLHRFIGLGRERLDVRILTGRSFLGEERVVLFVSRDLQVLEHHGPFHNQEPALDRLFVPHAKIQSAPAWPLFCPKAYHSLHTVFAIPIRDSVWMDEGLPVMRT
jgi:hypothetical protein